MELGHDNLNSPEGPQSQLVMFALEKLMEESVNNEKGIWGFFSRRRLSHAMNAVKKGDLGDSVPVFRRIVDRYDDFATLDYQLSLGRHDFEAAKDNPFRRKVGFYGLLSVLVRLDLIRKDVAAGKKSLEYKQKVERLAETSLAGKTQGPIQPNLEGRLLEELNQLKAEIWG